MGLCPISVPSADTFDGENPLLFSAYRADALPVPVYDLTVDEYPEFFANGVLVHNSSLGESACYTAGVLLAKGKDGGYFVEHVEHGQWEPVQRNNVMRAIALKDRARYGPQYAPRICVEREGGSSGRDAWLGVVRALAGFHVEEITVTGSKDARAEPWSTQCAAGNVHLVEDGTWNVNAYIEEHCLFRPEVGKRLGKYKDQVDASSGAFNYLSGMREVQGPRVYAIGKRRNVALRILMVTLEELANTPITDDVCLLLHVTDPDVVPDQTPDQQPTHGISKLAGWHRLRFLALSPDVHQESWAEPVAPYDRPAEQLMLSQDDAKRMWGAVNRRREPHWNMIVVADDDADRRLSLAMGLADSFRYPRNLTLCRPDDEAGVYDGVDPPAKHVYQVVRASRQLVM